MDTCIYKMKTGKHALVVIREYILHALVPLKMKWFPYKGIVARGREDSSDS